MKKIIVLGMTLVLAGIAMTSCNDDSTRHMPKTYIVPHTVRCVGHLERERLIRPYPKKLICDDGRVFHNIVNYQEVINLNPLYQGE